MAINNDNTKVTDVFGQDFEAGSDGAQNVNTPAKRKNQDAAPNKNSQIFKGQLVSKGGKYFLLVKFGGVLEVVLNASMNDAEEYLNQLVTIQGTQDGAAIYCKAISGSTSSGSNGGRNGLVLKHTGSQKFNETVNATREFRAKYNGIKGVLAVRPGYKFVNGAITDERAIVVVVESKVPAPTLETDQKLPQNFNGFDVEVVPASPMDLLRYKPDFKDQRQTLIANAPEFEPSFMETAVETEQSLEAAEFEAARVGNSYVPPSNVHLDAVTAPMTLLCHVSPEEGWKNLKPFLDHTSDHLEVAMYDFSAPGIYASLKDLLQRGASLTMVYDGNPAAGVGGKRPEATKKDDIEEDTIIAGLSRIGKNRFKDIKAFKGAQGICYNAYHIKVAVRDDSAFWLSSGNWQSSNQPNQDFQADPRLSRDYNREWNVIIENDELADIYQKFIEWDFEKSSEKESALIGVDSLPDLFLPEEELEAARLPEVTLFPARKIIRTNARKVKVQPVLSPDNYIQFATEIIKSAKDTLYFQNQYIKISKAITPEYDELLTVLQEQMDKVSDARIILRSMFADDDRAMLEALKERGFDMKKIKLMKNTHTKGIIADGKRILIGSHNWSNAGVQFNRDASLLIYDDEVAEYYQDVFLHDWLKRTKPNSSDESSLISEEAAQLKFDKTPLVKVDWREYFSS